MADCIIPISEVAARTNLCRRTIYNLVSAGKFPRQVQLSVRRVGWRESEVDAWIAARLQPGITA